MYVYDLFHSAQCFKVLPCGGIDQYFISFRGWYSPSYFSIVENIFQPGRIIYCGYVVRICFMCEN